ncbi:hypothetical protein TSUD_198940, partial [Trifolium subterraneum]
MKERASTLVFQPHYHYTLNCCGAQCTYSLYDKQVNGAGGNCFAPDCDSPLDTLLVGALLVVAAFPSLEPFPSARSPTPGGWREEDKKTRSVLLVSQLVASKSKGCPLSAGCWSSLLRGSRIQQPNLKKGKKKALSRLDEAYLIIMYEKAFPSRAYLVLVLRSKKTDALRLTLDWLERGEVRVRGMGFFSWCANAHFRFPFTS